MKRFITLALVTGAAIVSLGPTLPADAPDYSVWLTVTNLGMDVNSPGPAPAGEDNTPFVSRDGLSLYFMSNRPGGYGDADLYLSTRKSREDDWGVPQNLGHDVNSSDREFWPTLSPDGHRLYFSIVRGGNFDIYVSYRRDKKDDFGWEPPVPVVELNTPYHDVGLVFFEEEKSGDLLGYFSSARPTSHADVLYDSNVYFTVLQEDGAFSPPAPVPGLNTDANDERLPSVRRDGLEVFFDRAVPTEQVGLIFTATRESQTDTWSTPLAVPWPVNGDRSNISSRLSFDGTELYFASSRRNLGSSWLPFLDVNVATREKLKRR